MTDEKHINKISIVIQILTLLSVVVGFVFNHYSQKSLIEHQYEVSNKEAVIFGTAMHMFIKDEHASMDKLPLTQVRVFEDKKYLGDMVRLGKELINFPVLISIRIENRGKNKADNVEIVLTSPLNSLMHGSFKTIKNNYSGCLVKDLDKYVRVSILCKSVKRGETKSFSYFWVPNFYSEDMSKYKLEETYVTDVDPEDLIQFNVVSDNSPKGIILEGPVHIILEQIANNAPKQME